MITRQPHPRTIEKIRLCIVLQAKGHSDEYIRQALGYKSNRSVHFLRQYAFFQQEAARIEPKILEKGWQPIRNKRMPMSQDELEQIRILNGQGTDDKAIARILGRNHATIKRHRKRLGLKAVTRASDETIAQIIQLRTDENKTYREIGEIVGMDERNVGRIVRRELGLTNIPTYLKRLDKDYSHNKRLKPYKSPFTDARNKDIKRAIPVANKAPHDNIREAL